MGEDDDLYMMQSGSQDDELIVLPKHDPLSFEEGEDSPIMRPSRDWGAGRESKDGDRGSMRFSRQSAGAGRGMDMERLQRQNKDTVISQCPQLRADGVLLVGSVLSANLSPADDESSGPVSFRVLFVEGSDQPMMFRCKTPIYSSEAVDGGDNPLWDDGSFRFAMTLPEIGGDVMISLYRARPSGGNDLVGQVLFDLKQLVLAGTVEHYHKDVQGRSLAGQFPLLTGSRPAGQICVQMCMAWRSSSGQRAQPAADAIKATLPSKLRPASGTIKVSAAHNKGTTAATASRERPRSVSASRRPASVSVNRQQGSSPPRKIVSKFMLKQQKEARKISMENKKLQQVLQQHSGRTSAGAVYQAAGGGVPAVAEEKSSARSMTSRSPAPPASTDDDKEARNIDRLKDMHDKLKADNAQTEAEIAVLRAKVSNINIQTAKATASIDKGRSHSTATTAVAHSIAASKSVDHLPSEEVPDLEYQQIKEEYDILQGLRRGFLARIQRAKQAALDSNKFQQNLQNEQTVLRRRLFHVATEQFREFLLGDAPQENTEDEGALLCDQAAALAADLSELRACQQYGCADEMLQVTSSRRELEALHFSLQSKIRSAQDDIRSLRAKQDDAMASLQTQVSSKELYRKREFLVQLKTLELSLGREQRQVALVRQVKKNEMDMVRLRMMAAERKAAAGAEDEGKASS